MSKFDSLDLTIITHLNQNARLSSAAIARKTGVSERTINNRIKRLIDSNALQPIAFVNPAAFGFTLAIDIFCELEVGHQDPVIQALLELPEISYIAISTGDQDLSLQALFKDSDDMHEFITNKLHQIPGMRRTRAVLIPRIIKESSGWLPPEDAFQQSNETPSSKTR